MTDTIKKPKRGDGRRLFQQMKRAGRECAVQMLYLLDASGDWEWDAERNERYWAQVTEMGDIPPGVDPDKTREFSLALFEMVLEHRDERSLNRGRVLCNEYPNHEKSPVPTLEELLDRVDQLVLSQILLDDIGVGARLETSRLVLVRPQRGDEDDRQGEIPISCFDCLRELDAGSEECTMGL